MSNHEDEKFEELVREGQEEQRYQEHLHGGEICQGGQCPYCEEEDQAPLDEFEYQGPRIKAVAWWGGSGWHVQVEGYPQNHGDSFLSPHEGLPNGYLETWAKCRPWFDIRKEGA